MGKWFSEHVCFGAESQFVMHPSVSDSFFDLISKPENGGEGIANFMYLDVAGLVTTGIGAKIDPFSDWSWIQWVHRDGSPASAEEAQAEWTKVKGMRELGQQRNGLLFENYTNLRLSPDSMKKLNQLKLKQNEDYILQHAGYTNYANWPAEAQLAVHSIAWACGPGFFHIPTVPGGKAWVNLHKSLLNEDWVGAAKNATGSGLVPLRNKFNQSLFETAAKVAASGANVATLYHPSDPPGTEVAMNGERWYTPGADTPSKSLGYLLAFRKLWDPYVLGAARIEAQAAEAWHAVAEDKEPSTLINLAQFAATPDNTTIKLYGDLHQQTSDTDMSTWNQFAGKSTTEMLMLKDVILEAFQNLILSIGTQDVKALVKDCPQLKYPNPPSVEEQLQIAKDNPDIPSFMQIFETNAEEVIAGMINPIGTILANPIMQPLNKEAWKILTAGGTQAISNLASLPGGFKLPDMSEFGDTAKKVVIGVGIGAVALLALDFYLQSNPVRRYV
jgi:hypothetical protein